MKKLTRKVKFIVGGVVVGVVLIGGLITTAMLVERVEVGTVGVVYNLKGVEKTPLSQGWHIVAPFDKVIEYPIKTKTVSYESVPVATADGKNIDLDISFNFNVDATKAVGLYNKFGAVTVDDIANTFLKTRLRDASRQVVSKYSVIDIYGEKSSEAQAQIQETFAKDVDKLGFTIEGLMLGVPKADSKTQEAIDSRVQASQELERKKTELSIAKAEAERLQVEAQGKAEANRIISESLTDKILQKQAIDKWDGKTPLATSGTPFINLPTTK